jgi:hypothetical protein
MIPTTSTGVPVDPHTYQVPSPDQYSANQIYWDAYKAGQQKWIPNPAGIPNPKDGDGQVPFWTYQAMVSAFLLPQPRFGADVKIAGTNDAVTDSRDWLWDNDPNSPRNKSS